MRYEVQYLMNEIDGEDIWVTLAASINSVIAHDIAIRCYHGFNRRVLDTWAGNVTYMTEGVDNG